MANIEVSSGTLVVVLAAILVGAAVGGYALNNQEAASTTSVAAEGDIDTWQGDLQSISDSSDLSTTEQDLNTSGLVDDGNVVAKYNLSGTDGDTHKFAAPVEVDGTGGIDTVETDVTLDNTTGFELRSFYLVKDTGNNELSRAAATHDLTSEIEDSETIDTEIPNLASADWAIVAEVKSIDTDMFLQDENILSVDLDGSSDDSDANEELHYTIDNAS